MRVSNAQNFPTKNYGNMPDIAVFAESSLDYLVTIYWFFHTKTLLIAIYKIEHRLLKRNIKSILMSGIHFGSHCGRDHTAILTN